MARLTTSYLMPVLVVALFAAGCSSTTVAEPQVDGPAITDQDNVDPSDVADDGDGDADAEVAQSSDLGPAFADDFTDWASGAEGGGVAYVRDADGRTALLAAGDNPQAERPLDPDDRVRVGSISKVFTSVMVLQLVDEGLVELDAPISNYVDDLAIANDVTVRQLLSHRTGIPNYTDSQGFFQVVVANPDRKPLPEDLVAFTNGATDFEPGSQFAYSNTNFVIAGMLIESVTGTSLADALDTQISGPLGLRSTEFADGTLTDVAGGYSAVMPSGNSFEQSYTSIAYGSWAAGGLVTTVSELATFLEAAVRGDLISEASQIAMREEIEAGGEYGLGLHPGSNFGVGHGGAIIGFNSLSEIDPETGELLIVVVNNDGRNPEVPAGRLAELLRGK